jgi:NADPH-dependent 2,4-dienoyl-CoA reductase/sulfur reductase-like enzyme
VKTDECLRAAPDVYAAGDIAYFPYAYAADDASAFVRIEHWVVAMDQVP